MTVWLKQTRLHYGSLWSVVLSICVHLYTYLVADMSNVLHILLKSPLTLISLTGHFSNIFPISLAEVPFNTDLTDKSFFIQSSHMSPVLHISLKSPLTQISLTSHLFYRFLSSHPFYTSRWSSLWHKSHWQVICYTDSSQVTRFTHLAEVGRADREHSPTKAKL